MSQADVRHGRFSVGTAADGDEAEGRVPATYGGNYRRLTSVKAKYDPRNLFRVNQNIQPASA